MQITENFIAFKWRARWSDLEHAMRSSGHLFLKGYQEKDAWKPLETKSFEKKGESKFILNLKMVGNVESYCRLLAYRGYSGHTIESWNGLGRSDL